MLKKIIHLIVISTAALMLASCSVTAPLAVSANPIGKKVGTAKARFICGLYFGGDFSTATAAKNGGITKVSTVDVKLVNVLYIFMSRTTIVTGE